MKKKILLFIILSVLGFIRFNILYASDFSGTVRNIQTNIPIANQAVYITDSMNFYHTVYTNSNGFFYDTTLYSSPNPVTYYLTTFDCNNVPQINSITWTGNLSFLTAFNICSFYNDAGVFSISYPDTNTFIGDSVAPVIKIKNFGTSAITSLQIGYKRFGFPTVFETWTGNLLYDSLTTYTFSTKYITPTSNYSINAFTHLAGDSIQTNDSLFKYVIVHPHYFDAGIINIISPGDSVNAGTTQQVTVTIKNFGITPISNLQIYYQVGSQLPIVHVFTGSPLQQGDTANFTFTPQFFVPTGTLFSLCAYTNIVNDTNNSNDTLCKNIVVNPAQLDVAVVEINSPSSFVCIGIPHQVKVVIKNNGLTPLTSIPITFIRNGSAQGTITENWTGGPLQYGDTIHYAFTQLLIPPSGGISFSMCAYTTLLNDAYKHNDTICKSLLIQSSISQLTISGEDTVVLGQNNVSYTANNYQYSNQYIWTLPTGSVLNSSVTNSININFGNNALSGDITCKVINSCGVSPTAVLSVNVFATPPTPVINWYGNTLYSNYGVGNQWYDANGTISGENQQTYSPILVGDYFTKVTLAGITSMASNIIHFPFVGIYETLESYGFKVFPNPLTATTTFYYSLKNNDEVRLSILDITGKEIIVVYENYAEKGDHQINFNAENLKSGIYFYHLKIGENNMNGKLLITK